MNLVALQRAFQDHVLHADAMVEHPIGASIASQINASERVPVATRLAIYSDAYRLRLIDALANNFPCLQKLIGVEAFAQLARHYIDQRPSTSVSVRWLGDQLAAALSEGTTHLTQPWLAELAQWEWAVATAFDAADATSMSVEALGTVAPERWPTLHFVFHPSVQRLSLRTNANLLFKALADDVAGSVPDFLESAQDWLIWRQQLATRYRPLASSEARALDTLLGRGTFEAMCEALCEWYEPADVPVRAATFLKGWLSEGLLTRVE